MQTICIANATGCIPACITVLDDASARLTQREILEQWPDDFRKPDQATISRSLKRCVSEGLVCHQGTGRKNDPFRYWLPGKEEDFPPGPDASPEQKARYNERCRAQFLQALGIDPKKAQEAAKTWRSEKRTATPAAALTAAQAAPPVVEQPVSDSAPVPVSSPIAATPQAAHVQGASPPELVSQPCAAPRPELPPATVSEDAQNVKAPGAVMAPEKPKRVRSSRRSEPAPAPPALPAVTAAPVPPAAPRNPAPVPEPTIEEQRRLLRMWPR